MIIVIIIMNEIALALFCMGQKYQGIKQNGLSFKLKKQDK